MLLGLTPSVVKVFYLLLLFTKYKRKRYLQNLTNTWHYINNIINHWLYFIQFLLKFLSPSITHFAITLHAITLHAITFHAITLPVKLKNEKVSQVKKKKKKVIHPFLGEVMTSSSFTNLGTHRRKDTSFEGSILFHVIYMSLKAINGCPLLTNFFSFICHSLL